MKPARKTSAKTVHAPTSTASLAVASRPASPLRRGQTRTVVASPVAASIQRTSLAVKRAGVPKPPAKRNTFAATELVSLEAYAALQDQQQVTAAASSGFEGSSLRAATKRRRQIDPTTCERDYSTAEIEFMNALDDYKRLSGRLFPTCSEILEVIRGLGYAKTS